MKNIRKCADIQLLAVIVNDTVENRNLKQK